MDKTNFDLIIIGGGPAGLTAAIYAARYNVDALVISKTVGGTAATAYKICNCPGYIEIKGYELMQRYTEQVNQLKVPIIYDDVSVIKKDKKGFEVRTSDKVFKCKKIVFSSGTERTRLNVTGEGKFIGRGVSYCATCDAAFFKNKTVAVIGGSNAALTAALLLSEYADKIYIIYRKEKFFRPEAAWIKLVKNEKKIECLFNEEVVEIKGDKNIEEVILSSKKSLKVNGVFVEAGSIPKTDLISTLKVKLNKNGYIVTDKEQKTNVKGFFAAGDITNNSLKQIVTASGEGAVAAFSAYKEMKEDSGENIESRGKVNEDF